MAGDKWHCSKCTFLHLFPAQRCTMCNALRVSKEEMRNFVQGKSSQRGGGVAESRHDGRQHQQSGKDDNQYGDAVDGRRNIPQHHSARQNQAPQMASNRLTNSHNRQNRAVVNPYAKKSSSSSRPTSSYNQSSTTSSNNNSNDSNGQQSIQNRNMALNENVLTNQSRRPPTANPYGNNRSTAVNASTRSDDSTGRNGYRSNNDSFQQQRNSSQQQQQQRPAVNNPYNKSISMNSASTASHHSNAPIHNVQASNTSFVASRQHPQHPTTGTGQQVAHSNAPIHNVQSSNTAMASPRQHPQQQAEAWQQATNSNNSNSNATSNKNNVMNSQQNTNQNLHRFFTGGRQPSQRPQPQEVRTSTSASGNHHHNNNNSNASTSILNNNNRQRLSLSAKKQLPYTQGPVPLCPATSHNWIYPTDDKYPERTYQLEMSESAILYNTLVSLPTGLGKTLIAAVVMYNYYRWFPEGKVVFCAPTRPLVTQQIQACYNIMGIPERHTCEISGRVNSSLRKNMWDTKRVFFCTPQTLVKDIEENRCDASKIVCVVVDEAHRATGMHTFALLPNMIEEAGAKFRLVALSATPGTDIKSIQAVVETLKISKIEARTEDDPNVKRYIHNREEEVISVKQPDVIKILDKKLLEFVRQPLEKLRSVNAATRLMGDSANLSPFAVMKAQEEYINRTGDHRMYHTFQALRSLVDVRINLKNHGVQYALQNIARKEMEAKGPLRTIFHSEEFRALKAEMQTAAGDPTECLSKNNPKYEKLTEVLLEHFQRKKAWGESTRVIVFSQLRESVMGIVSMLSSQNATLLKPTPFVGQSRKKDSESNPGQEVAGMNQAEQQRILRQFNEGVFNVLVCTCVGEEGLDIGDVDLIVNFDILKSAIRSIQRTGRTGRKRNGRVIFLVSEGQEERSYRDSVTNSKKIARALKDPSVFKLCPNSPMFPDEPALLRQKMVVNDFHMSQVGGHTPKTRGRGKAGRSSKRNGDKVATVDDSWTLNQAQQRERMHLFGNLPYSSHSAYEAETMQGDFPASLRKKYLKARRRPQQAKDCTGRGRSFKILACMEKLYIRPTERTESRSTPKKSSLDYGDDDMSLVGNANHRSTLQKSSLDNGDNDMSSIGNANHSATFDVEPDCGFAEDPFNESSVVFISSGDDLNQNGCNKVSPESNCKDLGAIFGTLSVKHSDCLDSQQVATLFDSDDHKNCSVRAPPPFGDFQCDESSDLCDESTSSYLSSESSKLSLVSVNTMNDDELCAFFENSPLPTASQHNPAEERRHASIDNACDNACDDNACDDNEVDFSLSRDDIEPHEEKGSPCYSPSAPEASFGENAELDPSVPSEKMQNTSKHILNCAEVKNGQGNSICVSSNVGTNAGGGFAESDHVDPERDTVNEAHSDLFDAIGGSLSPIAPLSQVGAFHLPTPPPSSSDEEEDDSDDDSDANKNVLAEENTSSNASGQDPRHYPPLEIDDARDHSTEFEKNSSLGGIDAEEEDSCKTKIGALQLPTQYSSSSDDDDDSEGESACEADTHMQVVEPNNIAPVTNEVGKKEVIQSEQKYAIGTKISKEFKDPKSGKLRLYQGEVRAFYSQDNHDKLYSVVFEDGDCEDMEEGEIKSHLTSHEAPIAGTGVRQTQRQSRSQMSPDDLTDTPLKANNDVRTPAEANSRMSLDSLTDTPVVQRRMPVQNSRMLLDSLTDTPVEQRRMPAQNSQMSMDSLTDTPVVQRRILERKSRMSIDSLTDTPVQQQQLPERKRLKPTNDVPKDVSKPSEKLSKQDRLKQRIEEKYRCKFLDTEAANDDSDSGDEDEEEDDDMSNDGFINDTSQLGYSQDDLDRLNESVEECNHEESDVLHRQLNHQQTVNNQFKTPILNRRMKLTKSDQSQSSLPPSQRGLGNMNFIRSVIDHCRQGGNSDEIETEYHRLVGESSSRDMSISQIDDDVRVESQPLVQKPEAEVQQPQHQPARPDLAMARNNTNNNSSIRVGLGSQPLRTNVAAEPNVSEQSAPVTKKASGLSAEQKAMIEAKRQAALRLRQQKQRQKIDQNKTQVRFNPYAK